METGKDIIVALFFCLMLSLAFTALTHSYQTHNKEQKIRSFYYFFMCSFGGYSTLFVLNSIVSILK